MLDNQKVVNISFLFWFLSSPHNLQVSKKCQFNYRLFLKSETFVFASKLGTITICGTINKASLKMIVGKVISNDN